MPKEVSNKLEVYIQVLTNWFTVRSDLNVFVAAQPLNDTSVQWLFTHQSTTRLRSVVQTLLFWLVCMSISQVELLISKGFCCLLFVSVILYNIHRLLWWCKNGALSIIWSF